MAPGSYSVAIVGGTGRLGYEVTKFFIHQAHASFPVVKVLTRDASTIRARQLAQDGAVLKTLDLENVERSLEDAFAGVDVVINVLNLSTPKAVKKQIAEVAVRSGVKVYFLSEFGVDHRKNDFPGYDHPDWDVKRELAAHARETARGTPTKVIALYTGLLIELTFGPALGFDAHNDAFSCFGSPAQRVTFCSMPIVAAALVKLSMLALEPSTSGTVPDELRIAGQTVGYEEMRDLVAEIKGSQKAEIRSEDLEEHKERLRQAPGSHVVDYIRVLMGEGEVDFSGDNANALLFTTEASSQWKIAEAHVRSILH
ncbi:NAD-P-binding protein [Lenzites betulinus]|nr:NAD-P-binding protein [Lenzites betulinus]